jgi:hypothetical protein
MLRISWRLILATVIGLLIHFQALGANLVVKEIQSVRGRVQLVENERAQSFLEFVDEHRVLNLSSGWQSTNIEYSTQIGDQTAIVMGYSDAACSSRQALLIVTAKRIWGPYQLGGCEDTLIYQRGEANDSFVAMNPRDSMAWVYTVSDERFRGPAAIELPEQLRQFSRAQVPPEKLPAFAPILKGKDTTVNSGTAATSASTPRRAEPGVSRSPLPTTKSTSAGSGLSPIRPPKMSPADASDVANKVARTTRPQKQVVIDLT